MTRDGHGMSLVRRAIGEHRRLAIALLAGLVVNVLAFAFVVYPLSQRVANVEQREQAAAQALLSARQTHARETGTLTGKERAAAELVTFYTSVLPSNVRDARRLTHLRLHQLVQGAGLRHVSTSNETVEERNSSLVRLKIDMALVGGYDSLRTFLHELESAREFVVIDNVELSEENDADDTLSVTLTLSTYFRTGER